MQLRKGFTLIELLIVLGILGVLIIVALIALNPAEAQRKARDTRRTKELTTLAAIMDQWVSAGNALPADSCLDDANGCESSTVTGNLQSQPCAATNFLGIDVCLYANSVPLDPRNGVTTTFINPGGVAPSVAGGYRVKVTGSDYEINVRQESNQNTNAVQNDGGNSNQWAEAGSSLTLMGN